MADDRPIIIKRIKKSDAVHHGGAWKVAYADFVTAMMAFFLLLWLLNAVTEEQKKGIAQYFRPTIAPQSEQSQQAVLNGQPAVMTSVQGASAAEASIEPDNPSDDATSAANANADTTQTATSDQPAKANGEKPIDVKQAQDVVDKAEQQQFADVKSKILQQIQQDPGLADLKNNIDIQQTPEGLQIQLLDKENVSMFPSGSASMNDRSRQLLQLVAHVVSPLANKLSIAGHTDATPYQGRIDYSNWELSTDRANAARRVLVGSGVNDARVQTVSGKADTDPKVKGDPYSPENRRISIVLLRERPAGSSAAAQPAATQPAAMPAQPSAPPPEIVPSTTLQGAPPAASQPAANPPPATNP